MPTKIPVLLTLLVPFVGFAADPPSEHFDVVIIGGSSAGVGAAIGAGRLGVKVALIEDTPVLGGMLSNGISNIDGYSRGSMSGAFEEFRQHVKQYYAEHNRQDPTLAARRAKFLADPRNRSRNDIRPIDHGSYWGNDPGEGGVWEPQVADQILKKMLAPYPNVKVFYKHFASGVLRVNRRIVGVVVEQSSAAYAYAPAVEGSRKIFLGSVVVDATHEGDIAAWAGAPYRVGREARSPHEPHAGEIYVQEQSAELVIGSNGRQDPAPSGYILRLGVQCDFDPAKDTSHLLKSPPPDYDRTRYLGLKFDPARTPCPGFAGIPNAQAEWNGSEFRAGLDGSYWKWPEATRDERRKMYEAYRNVALGQLYFLQTERGYKSLGLAKSAWPENGNLPYRVFTREGRRILGEQMLNEQNVNAFLGRDGLRPPFFANSIGLAHYPIDAKPVEPKRDDSTPEMLGNGNMYLTGVTTATQIPYGAMLPQLVEGLLVPAALSATHVAQASIRQDPYWIVTGQAAGIAAALSSKRGIAPRQLPIQELQAELLKQKCKLVLLYDVSAEHPHFAAIQRMALRGIVIEREDRTFGPDEPLTRAAAAEMLVRTFDLWTSVTHSHFADVSYRHPSFRAIETLCDHGFLDDLGFTPLWRKRGRFDPTRDSGYQAQEHYGNFEPDKAVNATEFAALVRTIKERGVMSPGKAEFVRIPAQLPPVPSGQLTRAVAVAYLESSLSK
jgi:hypothetical protein